GRDRPNDRRDRRELPARRRRGGPAARTSPARRARPDPPAHLAHAKKVARPQGLTYNGPADPQKERTGSPDRGEAKKPAHRCLVRSPGKPCASLDPGHDPSERPPPAAPPTLTDEISRRKEPSNRTSL